jgi:hypothetical protein
MNPSRDVQSLIKKTVFVVGMTLLPCCFLSAAEYDITSIADEDIINRAPVLDAGDLMAWYAYRNIDSGESSSDIYIHQAGSTKNLTETYGEPNDAHIQPEIGNGVIVWEAALGSLGAGEATWIMKEVPRKTNDPPELNANYRIPRNLNSGQAIGGITNFIAPDSENNTTNATDDTDLQRGPSGNNEICMWTPAGGIERLTADSRNDLGPDCWGKLTAWQKARGWPFGWEIMVCEEDFRNQLTTNYYYDMGAQVQGRQVTWYGWDGNDFEIFLYNQDDKTITQITSNQFDDVSPVIWENTLAWEGYPAVEGDIYMWTPDTGVQKISVNIEDDIHPCVWNNQIVWQGFDGDDFEIYLYNGERPVKLTNNIYDDLQPDIRDGIICWMGYHDNWDAEIFVLEEVGGKPQRLTDNEYEDRGPRTAGGRIIWQSEQEGQTMIYLAEPR